MQKIIEVKGLTKCYGDVKAVKGIDFYVEKGSLFAFLGPNGAGKSTTIDTICTLMEADSGDVIINGHILGKDNDKIRADIGVVFQESVLDKKLTVEENLKIRGSFYGLTKGELKSAIEDAIDMSGCKEFANRPYGKLSGGQRRRADIARAFINKPKILFLDEPTTGLDPNTRQELWNSLLKLRKDSNMTIFLTTHYMEEAAGADYVAVIDGGQITEKGTPSELRELYSSDILVLRPKELVAFTQQLRAESTEFTVVADTVIINLNNTLEAVPYIEKYKDKIEMLEVKTGNMDDAFINITGGRFHE